ncbi:MAG: teicoplanin resistance protein VanZ [Patescibacteria group bacterium]|nr:MAG: teicoplanin resistance protein VanZ [Patescibacteria group bacterium]
MYRTPVVNFFVKKLTIKDFLSAFVPPTLWAIIIFLFSSQTTLPGFEESAYDFIFKKLAHITVYLVLYLLVFRAVKLTSNEKNKNTLLLVPITICLLYAISDEFHQSLVPGRYATLRDIGYDMLGVSIAFLKKYGYI